MIATTLLLQTPIANADQFNGFLLFGYFVMWAIGMLYLGYLYNRQRNLRQDMALLKRLLRQKEDAEKSDN